LPLELDARQEEILRILEMRERMSVTDLTDRLGVSEVTIRKDLTALEERGFLVRTRGGARRAEDRSRVFPMASRRSTRMSVKRLIGAAAARLVRAGETVFIDSGSTCLEVGRALTGIDIRVVTNSLDLLGELARHGTAVIGVGGTLRHEAGSFIGPIAVESLRRFNIDRAFVGTSGITADGAFSAQNTFESDVKRAAIAQAARVAIVADASKIGQSAFSIFASPGDVHVLVIDDTPASRDFAQRVEFEVVFAGKEQKKEKAI